MEKRKELGLTQEKAAQILGMNQGSLSHYLNGRNALNLHFSLAIASLLEVPVSSFSKKYGEMLSGPGVEQMALDAFKGYRSSPAGEKLSSTRWIQTLKRRMPLIDRQGATH